MSNIITSCDGYKLSHYQQYQTGTRLVYANWTPRKSRIEGIDSVVLFGTTYFIKKYLIKAFNKKFFKKDITKIEAKYMRRVNNYLPKGSKIATDHIRALHKLGYIPLIIKAIEEGSSSPIRCPQVVMYNTDPEFYWLVNYLETLWSCTMWKPCTSATIAREYRKVFNHYALETVGNTDFVPFQGHDFSMRGMSGLQDACASGAGHLLSFVGTDTIPAIDFLEKYYNTDCTKELIGCSVAATEHAVMCSGTGFYIYSKYDGDWSKIGEAEFDVFKRLITEVYPTGIISIVSDTFDLWQVLTKFLVELKDIILARDGKVVIRPDSGDPVKILTGYTPDEYTIDAKMTDGKYILNEGIKGVAGVGTYKYVGTEISEAERKGVIELLWETFGGTITEKGYKLLDSHIGTIYGDSITVPRAVTICERLKAKGYASINWIAGIGSYTYQYQTRDTFGYAQKSTYCEVWGTSSLLQIPIFKDPKTDDGTKKSLRGLVRVDQKDNKYCYQDQVGWEVAEFGALREVFKNGKLLIDPTLSQLREAIIK